MPGRREKPLILIVDDDEVSLMLACASLQETGFDVIEAGNGGEAIESVRERRPDAILLDVIMPEMDGYEVCRRIRHEFTDGARIPIIMMTSLDDPESIRQAYNAGATEFTIKPANWVVEAHRIRYLLQAAQAAEDLKHRDAELRQSQKMDAIGRLAGGVAHDFNNLLTAILSYSDLALAEPADPQHVADCIHEIKDAGNRAAGLTRQLLIFSRKQAVQPTIVNVNTLVGNMEKMLRRLLRETIEFDLSLRPDIGCVRADPGQIEQILMNLVVNAGDAVPDNGTIWIQTDERELQFDPAKDAESLPAGRYVTFSVRDNGTGMDEATQARAFEPFFTTKEAGKGTGLGLSTVFGIVKQIGGHVQLDSNTGEGTTFTVCLPRAEPTDASAPPETECTGSLRGQETVLVAEDESMIRSCIVRTLRQHGYTVLEAEDGQHALDLAVASHGRIHLLLTDVIMPGLGGAELSEKIAALHAQIRQVFMSGYIEPEITASILRDGKNLFLQKPFSMDLMLQTIRKALGQDALAAGHLSQQSG